MRLAIVGPFGKNSSMALRAASMLRAEGRRAISVVVAFVLVLHGLLGGAIGAGAHGASADGGVWIHLCSVDGDRYVRLAGDAQEHDGDHDPGPRHCPMCLGQSVVPLLPSAPIPTDATLLAPPGPACTPVFMRDAATAHLRPPPHGPPLVS